jgi:hypothetical protein
VGSQGSDSGCAIQRIAAVLIALGLAASAGCASAQPGVGHEADLCRAAETEVSGFLEAKKRLKGPKARYVTSLKKLPKDAHVPELVNGYPLSYTRTRKGFILECRYGKDDKLTSCTMNQAGSWECRHVLVDGT